MKLKKFMTKSEMNIKRLIAFAILSILNFSSHVLAGELASNGFAYGKAIEIKSNDLISAFDDRIFSKIGEPGISHHPYYKDRYIISFDSASRDRVIELFSKAYYLSLKIKVDKDTNGKGYEMIETPDVKSLLDGIGKGGFKSYQGVDIVYVGDDVESKAKNLGVSYKNAYALEVLSRSSFSLLSSEYPSHVSKSNSVMLGAFYMFVRDEVNSFNDVFRYLSGTTMIYQEPNSDSLSAWKSRVAASYAARFVNSGTDVAVLMDSNEMRLKLFTNMMSNQTVDLSKTKNTINIEHIKEQLTQYWKYTLIDLAKINPAFDPSDCLNLYKISNGEDIMQMIYSNGEYGTLCDISKAISTGDLLESTIMQLSEETLRKFVLKDGGSFVLVNPASRDFLTMFDNSYNVNVKNVFL
ncbi:hypothetical protein D051_0311 [Vibrio parahaemolyticus VPCR-2010]|uniref:hypothetical protein n=1 Tax=Vibrio parahaemolyticus TaxID=670 RepID=UPI00038E70D3|nr:hypothetical protein D051_0311 [Vibrio parahaemolyticus VPCR-2010]